MKFLVVSWTALRAAFEASVWATAFWCISDSFFDIPWIHFYWVFSIILFLNGFSVISVSPELAGTFLKIEIMLVGLAISQSLLTSLIPSAITIVVMSFLSHWTGREPDWLHVWFVFACVFYILWRRQGKRKAVRAWAVK